MRRIDAGQEYKAKASKISVRRESHVTNATNFQSLNLSNFDKIGKFFEDLTCILCLSAFS
jgi:hypothetical protein